MKPNKIKFLLFLQVASGPSTKKGSYTCVKCDTWYSYECDLWMHNKNNHADDASAPKGAKSLDNPKSEDDPTTNTNGGLVVARKSSVATPPPIGEPAPSTSRSLQGSLVLVNGVQATEVSQQSAEDEEQLIGTVEVDLADMGVTFDASSLELHEVVVFDQNGDGTATVQQESTTSDNFSVYLDGLLPVEPSSLLCEADQLFLEEDCRRDLIPI